MYLVKIIENLKNLDFIQIDHSSWEHRLNMPQFLEM